MPGIEGSERDSTQDWVVPRGTVPTVSELETRIDEALVIARASEEGVREVGEIALDAARQARRAAEAAEASALAAKEARDSEAGGPAPPVTMPPPAAAPVGAASPGGSAESAPPTDAVAEEPPSREFVVDPLQRFNERADAIAARLRQLERVPV